MLFTLNYCIDGVAIALSVTAATPEQGESMMKKCISKMLRNFPVGQLFNMLIGIQDGQLGIQTNQPDNLLSVGQWGGLGQASLGQGSIMVGPNTVPNTLGYTQTVTGLAVVDPNGGYTFENIMYSNTTPTPGSGIEGNASFSLTATGQWIGNNNPSQ